MLSTFGFWFLVHLSESPTVVAVNFVEDAGEDGLGLDAGEDKIEAEDEQDNEETLDV